MAKQLRATVAVPLAHRVSADGDAAQVARVSCEIWHEIDTVLRPIIGLRGAVALFNRSVQLTSTHWPVLAHSALPDTATALETAALQSLLAQCSPADALACGNALLHTFHHLLSTLIGASLTERLLRSVWGPIP